jgi:preprotein translocase subunit YajC
LDSHFIAGWFASGLLAEAGAEGGGGGMGLWPAVIASLVAMYFIMIRPERRRERDLQHKLEALKKNDRVVTVGGVYGVVLNVRRDADEVTLKIDEDTNTKMKVTLRSVARVVDSADDASSGKS